MASTPVVILAFANDQKGNFLRSIAEEHRNIKSALTPLEDKGLIKLLELPNVQVEDVYQAFRQYKDQVKVFHYGGHADGLRLLLNSSEKAMDVAAFAEYLAQQRGMELVFMNACTTASQEEVLQAARIPHLILTHEAIGDEAAKSFAREFYQNLASGRMVKRAFDEASAVAKSHSEQLYRALEWEEEQETDKLPWLLSQAEYSTWSLPISVPFPWKKVSLIALSILLLLTSAFASWKYLMPFDLKIPLKFPEGVHEKHFINELDHEIRFMLSDETYIHEIEYQEEIVVPSVNGKEGKVKVELLSSLWKLDQPEIEVVRNPEYLQLSWKPNLMQIQGKAVDEDEATIPIEGVNISLQGSNVSTVSGKDGSFVLMLPKERIGEISYMILSYKKGYRSRDHSINLSDDQQEYVLSIKKERP